MIDDASALEYISEFYLSSSDFNGVPVRTLRKDLGLELPAVKELLVRLLRTEQIDLLFGNIHPNPHIKAFSQTTHEQQLQFLEEIGLTGSVCVYPGKVHLMTLPLEARFEGRPFDLELARGNGQLEHRAFDLAVLEHYRNDPRFAYETNFINGSISIKDEYFESDTMPERDHVLMQTFGFAYDADLNRAVAVFLRYLADLSPEHQRVWHSKMLGGDYKLHPDYFRSSILGEWATKISIFEAFTMELKLINEMSVLIGNAPLFRQIFDAERPRDFGFLLRPTLTEFNAFVLLLDKMLSDNIDKAFFENELLLAEDRTREDGKIEVRQKGTLALLEEWLRKFFRPANSEPFEAMFKALRTVRHLRQKPAHAVNENRFDQAYFKQQRQLMIDAYAALRTLRLVLANHPKVRLKPPKIQKELAKGDIWDI